jgi:chromosome segregation ATPase
MTETLLTYLINLDPGTFLGLVGTLLGLVGAASGIVVGWRSAQRRMDADRREAKSQAIDDLDQVRKALMEEITRLSSKVDSLEQENEKLRAEIKGLRAENVCLTKRVEDLEVLLEKLEHLKGNV